MGLVYFREQTWAAAHRREWPLVRAAGHGSKGRHACLVTYHTPSLFHDLAQVDKIELRVVQARPGLSNHIADCVGESKKEEWSLARWRGLTLRNCDWSRRIGRGPVGAYRQGCW